MGASAPGSSAQSVEVRDRSGLREALEALVAAHEDAGLISVYSYDGDIGEDLAEVCGETMSGTALGAYAVEDMVWNISKIVSYYEIEVAVAYKRTKEQMDAMVTASSPRYLRAELLDVMRRYAESVVINTRLGEITAQEVMEYIARTYYENPLDIIMLPVADVEIFPESGSERIVEITFGHRNPAGISLMYTAGLGQAVRNIAETAQGSGDGEILLALLNRLTNAAEYDSSSSRIGEYSTQNFNATAYGALVYGAATGEGYAMAYKALCDEMGIQCAAVLGQLDGYAHAWNIVGVDGYNYHVDAAMCDVNGVEKAFLKNDAEMAAAGYAWNTGANPICEGPLSYSDFYTLPEDTAETETGEGTETETERETRQGTEPETEAGAETDR
jgi:hypothetical protein